MTTVNTAALRELLATGSALPWRDGLGYGAIVSDDLASLAATAFGPADVAAYGGALVAESISPENRAKIIGLLHAVPALLDRIDELETERASDAAVWSAIKALRNEVQTVREIAEEAQRQAEFGYEHQRR
jgi:hypothetical protein